MKEKISIVIPCYNEEAMIELFYKEMSNVSKNSLKTYDFEYIFVNDGSSDRTLEIMRKLSAQNPSEVRYLSFSRNFGKEAALYAGLKAASGGFIVVMDVDLQDPPSLLPEMISLLKSDDYDCVGTRRTTRVGEPPIRSFFAKQFYKLINRITDIEIVDGARDYRIMTRQMTNSVLSVSEYNRFSKGIFSWVGYNTTYINYENVERMAGKTNWSFWGLFKYSLDGIVSFSEVPLSISSFIGLFSFIVSILMAIFFSVRTVLFNNPTEGWTSLMVVILGLGGIQLFSIGILGKYVGKMFLEAKKRPLFVIKEHSGIGDETNE